MAALPVLFSQFQVSPVLAHFGLDEILVDGRKLNRQRPIQGLDDFGFPLHYPLLIFDFPNISRFGTRLLFKNSISRALNYSPSKIIKLGLSKIHAMQGGSQYPLDRQ